MSQQDDLKAALIRAADLADGMASPDGRGAVVISLVQGCYLASYRIFSGDDTTDPHKCLRRGAVVLAPSADFKRISADPGLLRLVANALAGAYDFEPGVQDELKAKVLSRLNERAPL